MTDTVTEVVDADGESLGMPCVFQKDNYIVAISDEIELVYQGNTYLGGYEVINIETGITEYMTTALPEAIFSAVNLAHAMKTKPWEWRAADEAKVTPKAVAEGVLN